MNRRLVILFSLLACLLLAQGASAQEVTGASLEGWGIYQATQEETEYSAQGEAERDVVHISGVKIVEQTDQIPLHEPVIIGLEYEVWASGGQQPVVVDLVVQKPDGTSVSGKAQIQSDTLWHNTYHINDLENADEGTYTFSVNYQGKRLVSKVFHMYR